MTYTTNSSTGLVTIFDVIIQGDSYSSLTLVVVDPEDETKDFTDTTAKLVLKQCGSVVYQNNNITLDTDTLGEVSFDLNLTPTVTDLLSAGSLRGEVQYTFPFQAGGEDIVKTLFAFNLKVITDMIA